MYVNERTLETTAKTADKQYRKLLELGYERGIIPMRANVDFVG